MAFLLGGMTYLNGLKVPLIKKLILAFLNFVSKICECISERRRHPHITLKLNIEKGVSSWEI